MPRARENPSNSARQRLSALFGEVCPSMVPRKEITGEELLSLNIVRFDLHLESDNRVPFVPLSPDVLREHPIDYKSKSLDPKLFKYREEFPPISESLRRLGLTEKCPSQIRRRSGEVARYLKNWGWRGFPRVGFPMIKDQTCIFGLVDLMRWEDMEGPNSFLRNFSANYIVAGEKIAGWRCLAQKEIEGSQDGVPLHPHIMLMVEQRAVGKDGTILPGELIPLVDGMRARASQAKLNEEEAKRLYDGENSRHGVDETSHKRFPLALENEHQFPVLLISCQGQHARILISFMEGDTLKIAQSKLYSFQENITAPWDLFTRWMLSSPNEDLYLS